jgi:predicted small secreted protein
MKRLVVLIAIPVLAACNTAAGVKKDVEVAGEKTGAAIKKAGRATGEALERAGGAVERTFEK